jgi:replication factor A3
MNEATPRITARYLEQFSNRMVRIVGKVTQLQGEEATIEASGSVVLHLNRVRCLHFP